MSNNRQELVNFYGDQITAIQEPSGEIYVVAKEILKNIGFNDFKIDNQRKAWNKDLVVLKGSKNLLTLTNGGLQQTSCISRKYIPLALAKISITPTMQREQPEIVEKLVRYQEECADVLYQHFYKGSVSESVPTAKTDNDPITREELAMYFKYMTDMFTEFTRSLEKRDEEREKYFKVATDLLAGAIESKSESVPMKVVSTNPLFKNTLSEKEVNAWMKQVWKNAKMISERAGKPSPRIFGEVYNILREEVKFDSLYNEYTKANGKVAKIAMCANSDYLRKYVASAFNVLAKKYFPEKYGLSVVNDTKEKYSDLQRTPDSVRNVITKYAQRNNISYKNACFDVYRQMKNRGRNINKEAEDYASSIGYSKCCNGYYVSVNPDLMDLLKEIVGV